MKVWIFKVRISSKSVLLLVMLPQLSRKVDELRTVKSFVSVRLAVRLLCSKLSDCDKRPGIGCGFQVVTEERRRHAAAEN